MSLFIIKKNILLKENLPDFLKINFEKNIEGKYLIFNTSKRKNLSSKNTIFNKKFISEIRSYIYIRYYKKDRIIELLGKVNSKNDLKRLLKHIDNNYPKDITIWIGINPKCNKISPFIKYGFNNAYITKKSPLNYKFNGEKIGLSKIKGNPQIYTCKLFAKLSPQAIEFLKNILHYSSKITSDPKSSDKEISGSLRVEKIIKSDKVIYEGLPQSKVLVYVIGADPKSIIWGSVDEVDAVWSRYNFHTHPKKAYETYGVSNGWPSGQDFMGFVQLNNHTIFHAVVTLEGIYIISFNSRFNGKKINPTYVKNRYDISHTKNISPQEYCNLINTKNYKKFKPLFKLKYMKWGKCDQYFKVSFKPTNKYCLPTDKSFNNKTLSKN